MKRLIVFLVRKRLGLKRCQEFRFENQKEAAVYFFTDTEVMKRYKSRSSNDIIEPSGVSLNWLLDENCKVIKL